MSLPSFVYGGVGQRNVGGSPAQQALLVGFRRQISESLQIFLLWYGHRFKREAGPPFVTRTKPWPTLFLSRDISVRTSRAETRSATLT